jgi:hypothetical protein
MPPSASMVGAQPSQGRLTQAMGSWRLKRKLLAMMARTGDLNIEDMKRNFARLDTDSWGSLDREKVELLLSWSFDTELTRDEWDALFQSLTDEESSDMVHITAIEMLFTELNEEARKKAQSKPLGSRSFIFDKQGMFISVWRRVMGLVGLYYFLSVPYQIAFLRSDLDTTYKTTLWVSYAFDCITVLNVLVKLNTAFIDPQSSVRITDRWRYVHVSALLCPG